MLALAALLRRDWRIERTYRLRLLLTFTEAATLAVGLFFLARLVGSPAALADYDGTYFDYVLVGLAVTSFASVGLTSLGASLTREQATGTIELLLASPVRPATLVAGAFTFPFLLAWVQVVALLVVGMGVAGSGLAPGRLALALPVLLLTTATFGAVGIAAAGVLLLAKRGDPLTGPFTQLNMLLSGAIVPLDVLPGWLRGLGSALPATWGIRATRDVLLGGAGWREVLPDTLVVAGFAAVLLPLSLLVFGRCLAAARRQGVLGGY